MAEENKIQEEGKQEVLQKISQSEIGAIIFESLGPNSTDEINKKRDELLQQYLKQVINEYEISSKYNILILYDKGQMVRSDADNIYSAITTFQNNKPILLILYSKGGDAGSAYLIGKLCREYSNGNLITTVPRHAKSAATLICCASDEIHMGSLSELGPIDPQIDNFPALGLKNSVEHIADLVRQYPASAEMFAKYLNLSLNPIYLGYYERVAQSAIQYAERLLKTHDKNLPKKAEQIALDLVYTYKDHGFVIDIAEAQQIFGDKIVKKNSAEYELGNIIYQNLEYIHGMVSYMGYIFYFIGSCDSKPSFIKKLNR